MSHRISECLVHDRNQADLINKLSYDVQPKKPISGISERDYPSLAHFNVDEVTILHHYAIPQELRDQLNHMQSNVSMGLFSEISRAWMTIDSDLFLWNSETNADLAYFDGITSTILKVALTTPRPGFFPTNIHKLLVVATTTDILLLAVGFVDVISKQPILTQILAYNDVDMFMMPEPSFKLPLDGLIVNDLCCTANGRIFFCADDCLYELEYHETMFYGRQCKKLNHSKSLLYSLIPAISIFSSKDSIQQISIDNSRHIVYCLTHKGHVQVFDLGVDGRSTSKTGTFYFEQIQHECLSSCKVDASFFAKIINVFPISCIESHYVYFKLVTSKGVRIYFTCLDESDFHGPKATQDHVRPKTIRILHIRFPPETQPFTLLRQFSVYSVLRTNETTMMALGPADNESYLWAMCAQNFISREFQENLTSLSVRGVIWDMAEVTDGAFQLSPSSIYVPDVQPLVIARQFFVPVLKYHVLTSDGIYTLIQNTPLEIFRRILSQYGNESKPLQQFGRQHGPVETCVMSLMILCSDAKSDAPIKNNAVRIFFMYGGDPQSVYRHPNDDLRHARGMDYSIGDISSFRSPLRASTPLETRSTNVSGVGSPVLDENSVIGNLQVKPSHRHDALFLYFSRIVHDIWNRKVCFKRPDSLLCSAFSSEELDRITTLVGAFRKAIDENSLITTSNSPQHFVNGNVSVVRAVDAHQARDSAAYEQEKQSLVEFYEIVRLSHEIFSLWQILIEHQFHVIISLLPNPIIDQLVEFTIVDLIHRHDTVCIDLITCLVKHYMGDDATTSAIADKLRSVCPTIFSSDDAQVLKATEFINQARILPSSNDRDQLLSDSLVILRKSIQKINLPSICDLLKQARFFDGIVELALSRAEKDDAKKLALTAYKKHAENVNQMVREAKVKRDAAYKCILELLEWLNDRSIMGDANMNPALSKSELLRIIKLVLNSDDELANVAVFRWILDHRMEEFLLRERPRFFESFLHHEIEDSQNEHLLELLWKFYEKNENYLSAAKLLLQLAEKPSIRTLQQRISYLSHASMCVQSAPETKMNLELKQEIQDKLDVAQIQAHLKETLEFDVGRRIATENIRVEELNQRLFTITELYDRYANPFDLPHIKLAILACAGHYEKEIVESLYVEIIRRELRPLERSEESSEQAKRRISTTLKKLSTMYQTQPKFYPIDMILRELLIFAFRFTQPEWLPGVCKQAKISYVTLLNVINNQYRVVDPFWKQNRRAQQFIINLVIHVFEDFVAESSRLVPNERKSLKGTALDFISFLSTDIHDQGIVPQRLRLLEGQIQRII